MGLDLRLLSLLCDLDLSTMGFETTGCCCFETGFSVIGAAAAAAVATTVSGATGGAG